MQFIFMDPITRVKIVLVDLYGHKIELSTWDKSNGLSVFQSFFKGSVTSSSMSFILARSYD